MDIYTTLIVAGFFFITGAVVVGLIWYLQGVARRARGKSKTAGKGGLNLAEVARLMRDTQTQDLVVEMDGETFKAAHELSPGQQHRLSFTSNVLAKWLVEPAPAPTTGEVPTTTPADASLAELPLIPADALLPELPSMPAEAITAEPKVEFVPPFAIEPAQEVKPVSTNLPDLLGGILNPTPKPVVPIKSIATQINDILQDQLAGTALESRGISLNDAPDHGVMVTLDGVKYLGVKDVPDEEVRKAIRAAVVEWETKK